MKEALMVPRACSWGQLLPVGTPGPALRVQQPQQGWRRGMAPQRGWHRAVAVGRDWHCAGSLVPSSAWQPGAGLSWGLCPLCCHPSTFSPRGEELGCMSLVGAVLGAQGCSWQLRAAMLRLGAGCGRVGLAEGWCRGRS